MMDRPFTIETLAFTTTLLLVSWAPAIVEGEGLTLGEAVSEATDRHPSVVVAESDRRIAAARRRAQGTDFIPRLETEGNLLRWRDELRFSVGSEGETPALPPPSDPYEAAVSNLVDGFEPTLIRESVTWDVAVRLTQPLTPLWATYEGWRALRSSERAAEEALDGAERDSAERAIRAYLEVLQADAAHETARASVDQLEAQLERVRAMLDSGRAQRSDRLRTEVALADARQRASDARSRRELARSRLATTMGRDPGNKPEPAEFERKPPTDEPPPLEEMISRAADRHPELQNLEWRLRQSRHRVSARRAEMLPRLSGVAEYKHAEGRGLTASDEAFVGLSLEWRFLRWGRPLYRVDEARARVSRLRAKRRRLRQEIELEVRRAWHDLRSAIESYRVASRAVARAEEAYRVESARFESGRATTSDVLDAERALTDARNTRETALYDILIHRTDLLHATGQPLTTSRLLAD